MPTEESRKQIYRRARAKTGVNKRQWARITNLGSLDGNVMANVGKKEKPSTEKGSRGVPNAEALAAGLLEILFDLGFDVSKIEFDHDGNITNIPRTE